MCLHSWFGSLLTFLFEFKFSAISKGFFFLLKMVLLVISLSGRRPTLVDKAVSVSRPASRRQCELI